MGRRFCHRGNYSLSARRIAVRGLRLCSRWLELTWLLKLASDPDLGDVTAVALKSWIATARRRGLPPTRERVHAAAKAFIETETYLNEQTREFLEREIQYWMNRNA